MKTNSIPVQYKATRAIPTWEKGATIEVDAKAYSLKGQSPYFSVTAMIRTPASRRRRDCDACGCLHDEILKIWPKLAPIVALHLSDAITGEPMHGESNGFYWLEGALGGIGYDYHSGSGSSGKTPDECLRIFADHCRIELEEAQSILRAVKDAFEDGKRSVTTSEVVSERATTEMRAVGRAWAQRDWKVIYSDMLPRFKREAEAGLALLHELAGHTVAA